MSETSLLITYATHGLCNKHAGLPVGTRGLRVHHFTWCQKWDISADMEGLKPPKRMVLEGNLSENWKRWKRNFEWFSTATGMAEKAEQLQCATLLHCIGEDAAEVYGTFQFEADEVDKIDPLLKKFEDYFTPKKNLTFERHRFNSRTQQTGESIDMFVTDLRNRAKSCEFGALNDSLIKDRIVYGASDDKLRERLLRVADLDLPKAVTMCQATEQSKTQMAEFTRQPGKADAHGVTETRLGGSKSSKQTSQRHHGHAYQTNPSQTGCGNCGRVHPPQQCPAFGKSCRSCGLKNHFERLCRKTNQNQASTSSRGRGRGNFGRGGGQNSKFSKSGRNVHIVEDTQEEDTRYADSFEELFINAVNSQKQVGLDDAQWHITLPLGPKNDKMCFKIDTGAQANVIPYHLYRKIRKAPALSYANVQLSAYDGSTIQVRGKCVLKCKHKNRDFNVEFMVANVKSEPILGSKASIQLGLIKRIYSVNHGEKPTARVNSNNGAKPTVNPTAQSDKDSLAILNEFDDLFHGIGCLNVPDHHISLKNDAQPIIYPPRKVPEALKPRLKAELQRLQENDIIASVDEPTDWVNPIVCVEKSDGTLRICLDPKELNKSIRREHYELPTADEISAKLAGAKYFSVLDASSSFWQIKLDLASSKLVTFNSCFGRYRFIRLPFGISSASEVFQKALAQILEGLDGVCNSMDDILVYADTKREHDIRLRKVLERLREAGLRLKRSKCIVGAMEIIYVGLLLTQSGVKPNPAKIEAILKMPHPHDRQSLQRFIGMVTYFGKFIPNLSAISAPLRELLQKDTSWHWEEPQERATETLKRKLTEAPVLGYYNPKKPVIVTADASKDGIGAAMIQENHPIAFASRALTSAEQNYAQIEKETLAATYACERFHQFVYGREFTIESDHKPLEAIVNKPLYKAPPRIQRFLLRLQKYSFKLIHVPGKQMLVADALSRANLPGQTSDDMEKEVEVQVHSLIKSLAISKTKLAEVQKATSEDRELQKLVQTILIGWPTHRKNLDTQLTPYWEDKEEYHIAEGIVLKANRIVVPESMRAEMLNAIHEGHLGTELCKRRAKETLFWPGMLGQIADRTAKCATCQRFARKQQKEPLKPQEIPSRPWQNTASDLFFFHCQDYLLIVDAYSGFFEVEMLEDTTSSTVIAHLKKIFARHGIPENLLSDNGPQYSSRKFKDFADGWGFNHKTSSPRYPRSNGLAERTVQTVKNLLKKAKDNGKDPYLVLLAYRDTPRGDGLQSPAQLLFGRKLRTQLPTTAAVLKPHTPNERQVQDKLVKRQETAKYHHDNHARKMPLKPLEPGALVRIHDGKEWIPGEVVEKDPLPRSFRVRTEDGTTIRRNRSHLKDIPLDSEKELPVPDYSQEDAEDNAPTGRNIVPTAGTTVNRDKTVTTRYGRQVKPNPRYNDFIRY